MLQFRGEQESNQLTIYQFLCRLNRKFFNNDTYAGYITVADGDRERHPLYQAMLSNQEIGERYGYAILLYAGKIYLVNQESWNRRKQNTTRYTLHLMSEAERQALLEFRSGIPTVILDQNHQTEIELIR